MLAGRNPERTEAVAARIRDAGGRAETWLGDLSDPARCQELVEAAIESYNRVDILVNSAGIIFRATAEETTNQQWRSTIAVNVDATFFTCLLYTSDAADDLTRVDLGGRRIIKKKKKK